jgi:hypothetical protein
MMMVRYKLETCFMYSNILLQYNTSEGGYWYRNFTEEKFWRDGVELIVIDLQAHGTVQ